MILNGECSSCKDIYYQAAKKDAGIGMATVYRMINTLEEYGLLHSKNKYLIECNPA